MNRLIPFVILAMAMLTFIFGMILLSYLVLFGIAVSLVMYVINWVKRKWFKLKSPSYRTTKQGRIIEANDWKKM